ncbi:hypothetical protein H6S82_31165, partial [Planktothrix sp. FACHB-1355]
MSLSRIALQQRQREEEELKSFLTFSSIGSVVLHIVVLSLSNFWVSAAEVPEDPIEVVMVDPPIEAVVKPEENTQLKAEPKAESTSSGGSQAGGTTGSSSAPSSRSTGSQSDIALKEPAIFSGKQPNLPEIPAIRQPVATLPPSPSELPKPLEPPVLSTPLKLQPAPVASIPPQPIWTPQPI